MQRLFKKILPDPWFARIQDQSRRWRVRCMRCGREKSVWDAGGLRFAAPSIGKRTAVRCSRCDRIVMAKVYLEKDEKKRR